MKKFSGLLICLTLLFACNTDPKTEEKTEAVASPASSDAAPRDYALGDEKYTALAKKSSAGLASGDIDALMADFADNAVYHFNNYDSIVGKPAITDYWKKRRTDVIDSMSYTSPIWLPMKVINPLTAGQQTGNYALGWQVLNAKYKTGKSIKERIHTVYHFNDNDKIDRVSSYLDRAPINAALAK